MIKLGYLKLNNDYDLSDEKLRSLTHINLAFAKVVDKKGSVEFKVNDEEKLKKLISENPNITFSLAIGGWSAGNFSEAASCAENRENFVKTTLDIVEKYNLDGIDIDWEYPCCSDAGISSSKEDKYNFTKLMSSLRKGLDKLSDKKYILTFAAGANEKLISCVELEELEKITDFVNLMTYDMGGSFGVCGHHASLYPSKLCKNKGGAYYVDLYHKNGYPKEKIVLGAAFYGRGATGVSSIGKQIEGSEGLYFDYHDIIKLTAENSSSVFYDEEAKAAYYCDGDTFITFETKDTILAKLKYVHENKLAGIMFWEYATDKTGVLLSTVIDER